MEFAFLLLGLLPLAFMSESAPADDAEEEAQDTPPPADNMPLPGNDAEPDDTSASDDLLLMLDQDPGQDEPPADDEAATEGDVLAPLIEDDQDSGNAEDPDPETILAPVDEPDVPGGGVPPDPEDVLLPVDDIDTESGDAWLNLAEDTGIGYSEITGFQPGQDVLQISLPSGETVLPAVRIELAENEEDSLVFVGDDLVAVLKGAGLVSSADVMLTQGPAG